MLQYRIDLCARNAWKPLDEIHDRRTTKILEEGADGNARAAEQQFAADFSGNALNSGTQAPIEHIEVYSDAVRANNGLTMRHSCVWQWVNWRARNASAPELGTVTSLFVLHHATNGAMRTLGIAELPNAETSS